MKILKMTAENVKRLKAVEITPKGALVQVTGRNGQGKTSVLDAIWWALAGKSNIQKEPLRRGEKKGRVELDLGDFIVERTFTEAGGGSIKMRNREGASYPSPQAMLDALVGDLSFDPLAFARMGENILDSADRKEDDGDDPPPPTVQPDACGGGVC